ncbi:PREDICTED: uncharacterized protein LOC102026780 [Chinchilla lanigera]|uniref:uncharacterized protein LOC102026780 n=1 Tax=Chinchilla lanigera TaxID=34839 RepID=UPI00069850CE|nr:PREDICTED: uncharacterized protein LOC102026780 [Chinchilla lanigera]
MLPRDQGDGAAPHPPLTGSGLTPPPPPAPPRSLAALVSSPRERPGSLRCCGDARVRTPRASPDVTAHERRLSGLFYTGAVRSSLAGRFCARVTAPPHPHPRPSAVRVRVHDRTWSFFRPRHHPPGPWTLRATVLSPGAGAGPGRSERGGQGGEAVRSRGSPSFCSGRIHTCERHNSDERPASCVPVAVSGEPLGCSSPRPSDVRCSHGGRHVGKVHRAPEEKRNPLQSHAHAGAWSATPSCSTSQTQNGCPGWVIMNNTRKAPCISGQMRCCAPTSRPWCPQCPGHPANQPARLWPEVLLAAAHKPALCGDRWSSLPGTAASASPLQSKRQTAPKPPRAGQTRWHPVTTAHNTAGHGEGSGASERGACHCLGSCQAQAFLGVRG